MKAMIFGQEQAVEQSWEMDHFSAHMAKGHQKAIFIQNFSSEERKSSWSAFSNQRVYNCVVFFK